MHSFTRILRLLLRPPRKRLRSAGAAPARGVQALLQRPGAAGIYWTLVWLSAFLLCLAEPASSPPPAAAAAFPHNTPAAEAAAARGARPASRPTRLAHLASSRAPPDAARRAQDTDSREPGPLTDRLVALAGAGMLLALVLAAGAVLFRFAHPMPVSRPSMILLFLLVSLASLAPSRWLFLWAPERFAWLPAAAPFLAPLALAPLLMSLLAGPLAAWSAGVWVSGAAAVLAGGRFSVFLTGLLATAVTARATRAVRSRAGLFRVGLWAGIAGAAAAIGLATLSRPGYAILYPQCLAGLAGGVVSALAAMLLLPLLELMFGISTDISLLELSDLEHPLLKRLAIEAPGTYHHSLMVANLTQAAVSAIRGNALRAGICAYFHDIGKLVKPSFFAENIQVGQNPHDDLAPRMSTLVIVSHVKEGVNLALRHRLPRVVTEAIEQHHGTGLVYFFYHKACQQGDPQASAQPGAAAAVKEEEFRYPGPRPRTREIAVLSLADAVEAASRSLERITPGHVEDLVREAIASKLRDGQLDACPLTLAELAAVQRALACTLTTMLHGRIAYPAATHDHLRSQPAAPAPG